MSSFDYSAWLADVRRSTGHADLTMDAALEHVAERCQGSVKFFKLNEGWGGIASDDTPMDVWVHFSAIEAPGYRSLSEGQRVVFAWEPAFQDSWRCRATWVSTVD